MELKIQAPKLRFLPTLARYYAICLIYNAVILAIFMFTYGLGFGSPFFDRPEVQEKLYKFALLLLVFPVIIALIAIAIRNRERQTHWIVGTEGINIFRRSVLVKEVPWKSIRHVGYYRKSGRLQLITDFKIGFLKTGLISISGIQRSVGLELCDGISKRIEALRGDAGGSSRDNLLD